MTFSEFLTNFFPNNIDVQDFIKSTTHSITINKGESISEIGSYNRSLYFVESGLLRSFYLENEKEITTHFYREGKLASNIDTLFQNQPTRFSIEALEISTIVVCDYEQLNQLCETSLDAANFARYILGNLLVQATKRISSLQYMSAREKYEDLLLDNKDIILRAPLKMIASYLGISPETLSRIRNNF